jgi:hypothetical protein
LEQQIIEKAGLCPLIRPIYTLNTIIDYKPQTKAKAPLLQSANMI